MNSSNLVVSEIPENVHITCIQRDYKVKTSKIEYIISAKDELDEKITKNLLRYELKELRMLLSKSTKFEIKKIMIPIFKNKDKNEKEKVNEEISDNKTQRDIPETLKLKFINNEERIKLIEELPEIFSIDDFVDKLVKEKGYSKFNANYLWKSIREAFVKNGKLERIKGTQKRDMRYKLIKKNCE